MAKFGWATIDLIPSAQGFGSSLTTMLAPELSGAGLAAGKLFGSSMRKGLEEAGLIGIAAAITGALFKTGATFNQMTDTIRVGTGATGAALKTLVGNALDVSKQVPESFDQIGTAITGVHQRLGLTGATLETFTKQFLEAGRITKETLDLSTVTGALTVFGIKGAATTTAMDSLFQVSQSTGTSINNLATAMKTGAPVLEQFGFGWRDSAAFLGALDKAGVTTETTLMALKIGLVNFAKAGRDPEAALKSTVAQIEAFLKVGKDAAAVKLADSVFGARGATQFVAAVKSGTINLDAMFTSIHAGSDTIIKAGQDTQHFAEQWDMFRKNVMIEIKPAADAVYKSFTDGMKWLNTNGVPILKDVSHWLGDNQKWLVATVKPLAEVYLAWKALLIVETVSKAMVGFVTVSKSALGVAVLYRAAMTALMDTQIAQVASTTALSAATNIAMLDTDALIMSQAGLGTAMGAATIATGAEAVSLGLATRAAAMFSLALDANPIGVFTLAVVGLAAALYELQKAFGANKSGGEASTITGRQSLAGIKAGIAAAATAAGITPVGGPGAAGAGGILAAAKNAADAKAAAIKQAAADRAAALLDAKNVAAAASLKAQAAIQAKLQLQIATEDQKKIIQDFARYLTQDFPTSIADASKKAADIISGLVSQVGSAISGYAATISDKTKADQFTLGATKISNKLNTDLFGFQSKLDAINKQRTDIATMIPKAEAVLATSKAAMASLLTFLATPFGTKSDLTKAFSGAAATVDTIIAGYDNLVKMVNDRFTTIDAKGNTIVSSNANGILSILKDKTSMLVALASTTVSIADLKAAMSGFGATADSAVASLSNLVGTTVSVADALKLSQSAYDNAKAAATNYADSLSGSLKTAGLSLSAFVTSVTLWDGEVLKMTASPSTLINAFAKRLTAIKDFSANVKALASRGLGQDLIDQITGMGVENGGALAASLAAASDAQLAALQASSSGITDTAKTLGTNLSDTFYANGVDSAKKLRDGLQSQQNAIDMQMTSIARAITDKLLPLVDGMTSLGTDSAQALLDGLKSKDAELLGWAQAIGAKMAQAVADALRALNTLSGGNNFGAGIVAANETAAQLQAAADVADLKKKQAAADAAAAATLTKNPVIQTVAQAMAQYSPKTADSQAATDQAAAVAAAIAPVVATLRADSQAAADQRALNPAATSADIAALANRIDSALGSQARKLQAMSRQGG